MRLCVSSFLVRYDAMEESSIVVAECVVAPVGVLAQAQGSISEDGGVPRLVEVLERVLF
jgi:hypothetical protein